MRACSASLRAQPQALTPQQSDGGRGATDVRDILLLPSFRVTPVRARPEALGAARSSAHHPRHRRGRRRVNTSALRIQAAAAHAQDRPTGPRHPSTGSAKNLKRQLCPLTLQAPSLCQHQELGFIVFRAAFCWAPRRDNRNYYSINEPVFLSDTHWPAPLVTGC